MDSFRNLLKIKIFSLLYHNIYSHYYPLSLLTGSNIQEVPKKCIHISRDVITVSLFEVELR
jgi:hypothetical protein